MNPQEEGPSKKKKKPPSEQALEQERERKRARYAAEKQDLEKASKKKKQRQEWYLKNKEQVKEKYQKKKQEADSAALSRKREADRLRWREKSRDLLAHKEADSRCLSLDMTDTPPDALLCDHDTKESVTAGLLLFWKRTGAGQYRDAKHVEKLKTATNNPMLPPEEREAAQKRLDAQKAELKSQVLTMENVAACLKAFQEQVNLNRQLLSCGACGFRSYSRGYRDVLLSDPILDPLKLKATQLEEYNLYGQFKSVASVVEFEGTHFYLHPEVISPGQNSSSVTLCDDCHQSLRARRIPALSVANGLDFGDLSRLHDLTIPPLTLVERHVASPCRMYMSIVKLAVAPGSSLLHGHVLTMRHTGPEAAAEIVASLPHMENLSSIQVTFVGSREAWEKKRPNALTNHDLRARPGVLRHYLALKKAIDPQFAHLEVDVDRCAQELEAVSQVLIDQVTIIDDKLTVKMDEIIHSDVANVRTGQDSDEPPLPEDAQPANPPVMSHAYLSNPKTDHVPANNVTANVLAAVATTVQVEKKKKEPVIAVRKIGSEPLNEFEENDTIFLSSFPHLFLFGRGVNAKGTLPEKFVQHLLHQRNCVFAKDSRFIFAVFNQRQRHQHARAASGFALKHPLSAEELGAMVNDEEFKKKLERAIKTPTGTEAKEIVAKLTPLITMVSSKSDFSSGSRAASLTTLYSYVQYLGCPSVFLTIAPDDIHSVMSIKMAIPSLGVDVNNHFPATDDGVLEGLKKGAQTFTNIDISELGLKRLLAENPVAATEIFKMTIEAVWSCLLGLPHDRATRKTFPHSENRKGIFGETRGFFSVTETQGRLSLHAHMVIWAGVDPEVIQKCAAYGDLASEIAQVLDSHFAARLPPILHYKSLVRLATDPKKREPLDPLRMTYLQVTPPTTPEETTRFLEHSQEVMNRCGNHQHSGTCEKGEAGLRGCRLCFPRLFAEFTGPVQLVKLPDVDQELQYEVRNEIEKESTTQERDFFNFPLPAADLRCIIMNLLRPFIVTQPVTDAHFGQDEQAILELRKVRQKKKKTKKKKKPSSPVGLA